MPGEKDAGVHGENARDPHPWGMGAGRSKSGWRRRVGTWGLLGEGRRLRGVG